LASVKAHSIAAMAAVTDTHVAADDAPCVHRKFEYEVIHMGDDDVMARVARSTSSADPKTRQTILPATTEPSPSTAFACGAGTTGSPAMTLAGSPTTVVIQVHDFTPQLVMPFET